MRDVVAAETVFLRQYVINEHFRGIEKHIYGASSFYGIAQRGMLAGAAA